MATEAGGKDFMRTLWIFLLGTFWAFGASAALLIGTEAPRVIGSKTLVTLSITNTFSEAVTSARATLFLLDDKGTMVGQSTRWVIGGAKGKPSLAPAAATAFSFVFPTGKPFATTKLTFSRIVLDGGKVADPRKSRDLIE